MNNEQQGPAAAWYEQLAIYCGPAESWREGYVLIPIDSDYSTADSHLTPANAIGQIDIAESSTHHISSAAIHEATIAALVLLSEEFEPNLAMP